MALSHTFYCEVCAAAIQTFGVEWVLPPDRKLGQQDQLAEMLSTVLVLDKLSEQVLFGQISHNSQEQSSDSHSSKSGNTNDSIIVAKECLVQSELVKPCPHLQRKSTFP